MTATHTAPAAVREPDGEARVNVRVWQLPIRLVHWSLVTSVVVLSLTGFYIGTPLFAPSTAPKLIMTYVHVIHVGVAYFFIALIIVRVAFAFTGNRYARWDQFLPVRRERRTNLRAMLRYYFLRDLRPPAAVGHNAMAGLTYVVLFAIFFVQTFTGLALEALENRGGALWALSGWVYDLAPTGTIRLVHHLSMWVIWGFVIQHVYAAVMMDTVERSGVVSAMMTGRKNVRREDLK